MSTDLGFVRGAKNVRPGPGTERTIALTRFSGGVEAGMCVQVTIGDKYVALDKKGVQDLRRRLKAAL
jgi:hypothetical protein